MAYLSSYHSVAGVPSYDAPSRQKNVLLAVLGSLALFFMATTAVLYMEGQNQQTELRVMTNVPQTRMATNSNSAVSTSGFVRPLQKLRNWNNRVNEKRELRAKAIRKDLGIDSQSFGATRESLRAARRKGPMPPNGMPGGRQDGDVMTLNRYMLEQARENTDLQELEALMSSIQMATKTISSLVMRSGISDLTGLQGGGSSVNIQGEEQKKLDVISNDVLKNALHYSGRLAVIASEEEDHPVLIEEQKSGRYIATFDPLDGSSNIDAAIATGTIFGIFEEDEELCLLDGEQVTDKQQQCLLQTLQPGKGLVASGYVLYSSSTIFVFTMGDGVHGFTLDPMIGEYVMTHPDIKIPKRGKIYSINEANSPDWDPKLQEYVKDIKEGKGESGEQYSSRYIGSMVGDVHRTLLYGGMFAYPADNKNKDGKLRLLYEAAPMGFIIEQAGGIASTGKQSIKDVVPTSIHERVPIFLGSPDDVNEVVNRLK